MPDERPIGIFDSGVGGLTVLRALQERLPHESTIYLGDLARCPYGPRPQSVVREFALQIAEILAHQDIKMLVVACNTATAAALDGLMQRYPFPVVGVIEPGAATAAAISPSGRIGVIATDGTVASGSYTAAIHRHRPNAEIEERSASWLVPLIERGPLTHPRMAQELAPTLGDFCRAGIDTLILGCTHFPLIEDLFITGVGPDITVLDSAATTAGWVAEMLELLNVQACGPARHRLLVTGPAEAFAERAQAMFRTCPAIETIDLVPAVR